MQYAPSGYPNLQYWIRNANVLRIHVNNSSGLVWTNFLLLYHRQWGKKKNQRREGHPQSPHSFPNTGDVHKSFIYTQKRRYSVFERLDKNKKKSVIYICSRQITINQLGHFQFFNAFLPCRPSGATQLNSLEENSLAILYIVYYAIQTPH